MMRPDPQKPNMKQPIDRLDRTAKQDTWAKPGSIACFDSIAQNYFSKYDEDSLGGYIFRERKARVVELLSGTKGDVLDVGCGPGVMAQDVLNLGCNFWGVDGSSPMITECRKRFEMVPRTHFSVGNAIALPFPDGTFDLVMCIGVIDRVVRPELAIIEMSRVLRPKGKLLVSFPNLLSPYALWRAYVFYPVVGCLKRLVPGKQNRRPDLCSVGFRLWTPRAASLAMDQHVGGVQAIAYYNFGLLPSPLDELFPKGAMRLTRRSESLRKNGLKWLGAGFILKAEKRCS